VPYNAHTTAIDALWAGLPVITCLGRTFVGRGAASALHAIGLPELVAENLEQYEARAARLAGAPSELQAIRDRLVRNRVGFPLFDSDQFRRNMEAAYTTMWEICERKENPRPFHVKL
jgi:predicted O-linked N-acetylglucosamine transferase (SPINDLY family)